MPVSVPDKLELNDAYVQHAGVTGMRVCTAWRGSDALASGDAVNSWGARVCAGGVSECVRSWEVMGGHGRSWEVCRLKAVPDPRVFWGVRHKVCRYPLHPK